MGRKSRAHRVRLQNLSKARHQKARKHEERPGAWNIPSVSRSHDSLRLTTAALGDTTLPSLTIGNFEEHTGTGVDSDNASASPGIAELTSVEHFSSILQNAQRRAAEAEEYRGKRAHYTGKSDRAIRRQKRP